MRQLRFARNSILPNSIFAVFAVFAIFGSNPILLGANRAFHTKIAKDAKLMFPNSFFAISAISCSNPVLLGGNGVRERKARRRTGDANSMVCRKNAQNAQSGRAATKTLFTGGNRGNREFSLGVLRYLRFLRCKKILLGLRDFGLLHCKTSSPSPLHRGGPAFAFAHALEL